MHHKWDYLFPRKASVFPAAVLNIFLTFCSFRKPRLHCFHFEASPEMSARSCGVSGSSEGAAVRYELISCWHCHCVTWITHAGCSVCVAVNMWVCLSCTYLNTYYGFLNFANNILHGSRDGRISRLVYHHDAEILVFHWNVQLGSDIYGF